MNPRHELQTFYNAQAEKYHQTRKKYRVDGQRLVVAIQALELENPKLLELGCGGGRFLSFLKTEYKGEFTYTGIDIAQDLLNYAQKEHHEHKFVCSDMLSFLNEEQQESLDVVVACASFQHLASQEERIAVMKNAYRALKYDGILLFTNRAFSRWFLEKHRPIFLRSAFSSFFHFGKRSWRDVFIPWKTSSYSYQRYYHLFSLSELKELASISGFSVEELFYLDQQGKVTSHWQDANNSFLLARKKVFL